MNFAWRQCPGCGAMFYGRRDMCLTCRLALESGEVQIVRMDDDEDGDKPAVVRAEDVLRWAEAVAGAASEEEGGEPEVPQTEPPTQHQVEAPGDLQRKRRRNVEAVPTHPAAAMDSESATRANIPAADIQTSDDDGARFSAAMQQLIDLAGELRRLGRRHHDRFDLEIIVRL